MAPSLSVVGLSCNKFGGGGFIVVHRYRGSGAQCLDLVLCIEWPKDVEGNDLFKELTATRGLLVKDD